MRSEKPIEINVDDLEFSRFIRSGDFVCWGQSQSEPLELTRKLCRQSVDIDELTIFTGINSAATLEKEWSAKIRFLSYCGIGVTSATFKRIRLDILPLHYSHLDTYLKERVDVVLVQIAEDPVSGKLSLSLNVDYLEPLMDTARCVIAEINSQAPFLNCEKLFELNDFDAFIRSDRPLPAFDSRKDSEIGGKVAENAATIVEDGATVQFGVGALPDWIATKLTNHRHLGLHSGLISDGATELIELGVIDNSQKLTDRGISIVGGALGSPKMHKFVDQNGDIVFRPIHRTHTLEAIASLPKFTAINSALEVDITGQVNTEQATCRYIGAVGGAVDFVRGARVSEGGISIIAIPSLSGHGESSKSRIVGQLAGPASIARSDTSFVVTEYGIADLRTATLAERIEMMISISHPSVRDDLRKFKRVLAQ